MSQLVAYISTISVWAVLCDEGGGWQLGRCSASIDKQMSILSTALTKVSNTKTLLQITPHARCFFCVCMRVSMHACMHLMYICRCVRACVWFWFCLLQCNFSQWTHLKLHDTKVTNNTHSRLIPYDAKITNNMRENGVAWHKSHQQQQHVADWSHMMQKSPTTRRRLVLHDTKVTNNNNT